MEEKPQEIIHDNPFFTRGCCKKPKLYQNNNEIFRNSCAKLDAVNWLSDVPEPPFSDIYEVVEVRFKNVRKDFFKVPEEMKLCSGDIVAVEASPGHDIGIVSLTGEAVRLKMKKNGSEPDNSDIKNVYRRARMSDIEKWIGSVEIEDSTMLKTRKIAVDLNLEMKINDVEYQGDNTKAIFYYTAEERVDFRELIKILAEQFKVRIEMRQIGVRQEASRLGGIGSCGRELCCSTWLTKFRSVTTNTARAQQLSLNPQKLAGQCSKLKCCLNYEHELYLDILKKFPNSEIVLKTKKGEAVYRKSNIFQKVMWYSYINSPSNMLAIPITHVNEIIEMNKKGKLPEQLEDYSDIQEQMIDFENGVGKDDLTRFDED